MSPAEPTTHLGSHHGLSEAGALTSHVANPLAMRPGARGVATLTAGSRTQSLPHP